MRYQPHWPLEPPDCWLGCAGAKEPQDNRGGMAPDGILGSLSDRCSDSSDGRAPTELIGGTDQLTRNDHRIRSPSRNLPQRVEEETDHLLGLPGREHQIGRLGDLGGREALW